HHFIATARNNACKNFEDYFHSDTSQNCFYNPDMFLETPALIEKYAGKVESHKVTTDDGYILTMFRIPRTKPKAFYLWHAGYDIWLSNARGTLFSEGHKKLKISSFQYWDFSFHEIGIYDISSQIKLIRSKINNSKISFIGHSMGTTTGLIYSSMHSLEAKNSINAFALLAIPVYFKYATSAIKYFVPYERIL
ncbi:Abhydro lipase domain containing protein, partial [Asbolus verrucosus]